MQTTTKQTLVETPTIRSAVRAAYVRVLERDYARSYSELTRLLEQDRLAPHLGNGKITQVVSSLRRRSAHRADLSDVSRRGLEIYDNQLRESLEPHFNGHVVAIHVDSGDFEVAPSSGDAMRAMRKRRPTGKLLLHTVGETSDTGLAARMSGTRIAAHRS